MDFIDWITKDAKWWEFWMPRSGFTGGMILVAIVFVALLLIDKAL